MRHFERALVLILTIALAAYAVDCVGMATPEQAMQCCKSMRCMSHHRHGEDCCKIMPTTHVDVGQPTSVSVPFAPVAFGLIEPFIKSPNVTTSERKIADQSHAPPIFSPPNDLPLRI
jgi:hypothetical protein